MPKELNEYPIVASYLFDTCQSWYKFSSPGSINCLLNPHYKMRRYRHPYFCTRMLILCFYFVFVIHIHLHIYRVYSKSYSIWMIVSEYVGLLVWLDNACYRHLRSGMILFARPAVSQPVVSTETLRSLA